MRVGSRVATQHGIWELAGERVRQLAIVGGGVAGWLVAATLSRLLRPEHFEIRLIERPRPQPEPVSVTALPSVHRLNALLALDEQDLMQRTAATFKLATQFIDWGQPGRQYFHAFGPLGAKLEAVQFQHHWLRLHRAGLGGELEDYSVAAVASKQARFAPPLSDRRSVLSQYSYGYHFHARSLAAHLRQYAQAHGVIGIERQAIGVRLRAADGCVEELCLDDGSSVRAELYIDCTGSDALDCQRLLQNPHLDDSHWLPCNRAVVAPCLATEQPPPYSQSIAHPAGWEWRVPLQACTEHGYAYPDTWVSDDEAAAFLHGLLPGAALADAQTLRLSSGRPRRYWERNWLIMPGSTPEPLESTALHRVQTGTLRLLACFPQLQAGPNEIEEYNRLAAMEYERIRDFLILHFHAGRRADSRLWEHCQQMPLPDSLRHRLELFRHSARIALLEEEHFSDDSWLSLLFGQGIEPADYDPLADALPLPQAESALGFMSGKIREAVATLPRHRQFIQQHCPMQHGWAP